MQQLLSPDTRANDPERFWNLTRDDRDEKRACRFDDMRKRDGPDAALDRLQLLRDRFGRGDDLEQQFISRFFHVMLSPKGAGSSIFGRRTCLQWRWFVRDKLSQF